MRYWAVALWLLTLLPVLGDSSDSSVGAKPEAVVSIADGQVPNVVNDANTDAESDNNNGIHSEGQTVIVAQHFSEYADFRSDPLRGLVRAYSIRAPPIFS